MTSPSSERRRFLLDCDPGIDDAFAIFCALAYGTIDVVTTVSGNVSVYHTTRNALHLLERAGAHIPVHPGADRPLVLEPTWADYIHGASGLGEFQPPEPAAQPSEVGAVEAILDYCSTSNASIVAIGPLTNIALAITEDPTVVERIERVYWMGGGTSLGNVTAVAEFNAWCDPHAASLVLESGVPLTMFDLDLTSTVRMDNPEIDALRRAGTKTSVFFSDALDFYKRNSSTPDEGKPMHDPCAILGFLRPDLFEFAPSHIVCKTGEGERGRTIVTRSSSGAPHSVAIKANASKVIELILNATTKSEEPS